MGRRVFFGCALLFGGLIAGCSDATAPAATLVIVVSPDTIHVAQSAVPTFVNYTERLVSAGASKVWIGIPEVETEVTPGVWQGPTNDPNNLYLQPALGEVWVPVTSADFGSDRDLSIAVVPGRHRIRQRYRVTAPNATTTGDILEVMSNPFVVVTP